MQSPVAVSTPLIDTSAGELSDDLSLTHFEYFYPSFHEDITDAKRWWLCERARSIYSWLKREPCGSRLCSSLKNALNRYGSITWPVVVIRDDLDVKHFDDIKLTVCQFYIIATIPTYRNWMSDFYSFCGHKEPAYLPSISYFIEHHFLVWIVIGIFDEPRPCAPRRQFHQTLSEIENQLTISAYMRECSDVALGSLRHNSSSISDLHNYMLRDWIEIVCKIEGLKTEVTDGGVE